METRRGIPRAESLTLRVAGGNVRTSFSFLPMKDLLLYCSLPFLALVSPAVLGAADAPAAVGWHAQTLGQAISFMTLFAAIGILLAIVGYKIFDKCTPGEMHREIIEHKNVAAAIIGGAVILGVCIIIAAAMLG